MRTYAEERQTLIFDGDDTLWENNVYFERAIADFIAYLDHSTLAPPEVRAVLDEIERANSRLHGYGSAVFACSPRKETRSASFTFTHAGDNTLHIQV